MDGNGTTYRTVKRAGRSNETRKRHKERSMGEQNLTTQCGVKLVYGSPRALNDGEPEYAELHVEWMNDGRHFSGETTELSLGDPLVTQANERRHELSEHKEDDSKPAITMQVASADIERSTHRDLLRYRRVDGETTADLEE